MKIAPIIGSSHKGPADNAKSNPSPTQWINFSSVNSDYYRYFLMEYFFKLIYLSYSEMNDFI